MMGPFCELVILLRPPIQVPVPCCCWRPPHLIVCLWQQTDPAALSRSLQRTTALAAAHVSLQRTRLALRNTR
jgi:hypothetical protein